MDRPRAAVVVVAGGSGSRAAARLDGVPVNKVFLPLAGRPVLAWSLLAADAAAGVEQIVVVLRDGDQERAEAMLADLDLRHPVDVVPGGASRHASEAAGLARLAPAVHDGRLDVVAVHDGARPLAGAALFGEVIALAAAHGGALPAAPAHGLVTSDGVPPAHRTTPGSRIVRVQTPQAFRAGPLLQAYARAAEAGFDGTDTSASVERFSALEVRVVPSTADNLKVTYPGDLDRAAALLSAASPAD